MFIIISTYNMQCHGEINERCISAFLIHISLSIIADVESCMWNIVYTLQMWRLVFWSRRLETMTHRAWNEKPLCAECVCVFVRVYCFIILLLWRVHIDTYTHACIRTGKNADLQSVDSINVWFLHWGTLTAIVGWRLYSVILRMRIFVVSSTGTNNNNPVVWCESSNIIIYRILMINLFISELVTCLNLTCC